jgi:hypothetical protein
MQLQKNIAGQWIAGSGKQAELIDAITGDLIGTNARNVQPSMINAQCSSEGRRLTLRLEHCPLIIEHSTFAPCNLKITSLATG